MYVRSSELGKVTVTSWHLRKASGSNGKKEVVFVMKMESKGVTGIWDLL